MSSSILSRCFLLSKRTVVEIPSAPRVNSKRPDKHLYGGFLNLHTVAIYQRSLTTRRTYRETTTRITTRRGRGDDKKRIPTTRDTTTATRTHTYTHRHLHIPTHPTPTPTNQHQHPPTKCKRPRRTEYPKTQRTKELHKTEKTQGHKGKDTKDPKTEKSKGPEDPKAPKTQRTRNKRTYMYQALLPFKWLSLPLLSLFQK